MDEDELNAETMKITLLSAHGSEIRAIFKSHATHTFSYEFKCLHLGYFRQLKKFKEYFSYNAAFCKIIYTL